MSFRNQTTNEEYELIKGGTIIMGRHKHGIDSRFVSENQLEINYLEDGRCFVKMLTNKIVKLNNAALPFQKEIQMSNNDKIIFSIDGIKRGKTLEFHFTLPETAEPFIRPIMIINDQHYENEIQENTDSSDASDAMTFPKNHP
ncbi:uncharacterized protein BX663DRAFT_555776 [Cokeromyces recurvatus]|uniref:uncharacterized protein n=1 Tax=Cokeromyces recurvatus TaxID=90255 RepID=UPI0022211130|nr:uncharacterized protein BX663DRAFT_555776 [Cokeromyces recurvatus]KAI7898570.1 hypothetical protein BX663DRAFT_555776 [Cokeromyces recurvatus]